MRTLAIAMLAVMAVAADESVERDPWAKVQALKHGSELRIYKTGSMEPILAKLDEVSPDRILIVDKKGQSSVSKEEIDRIDSRPPAPKASKKITAETTVKTTEPDYRPGPPGGVPVPGTSYSSGVHFSGSRESYETVYRRPAKDPSK
jgi:hypothetical protein